jgi:hypothetical protein
MGMFDNIKVKHDLPLPEEIKNFTDWKSHSFQTKDLHNTLSNYTIVDNQLVEHIVEMEYTYYTDEERKKMSKEMKWVPVVKDSKVVSSKDEPVNFHGAIVFYAYEKFDEAHDFWVDFKAYFSYGKLDKIELIEYKKTEVEDRCGWKKKLEAQQRKPWNRIKRFLSYLGWRWVWNRVARGLSSFSSLLSRVQMWIYRNML